MMTKRRPRLQHALADDHRKLEAQVDEILSLSRRNELAELDRLWGRFEDYVLAHMDGEEMHLLPAYGRHDPADARRILEEHGRIRELVAVIGIDIELHAVRDEDFKALARLLVDHAMREENGLYAWSEEGLSELHAEHLLRRIRRAWREHRSAARDARASAAARH